MKTDIDIKDDIFRFIKDSALHSEISGNIYKTKRPNNSFLEDITISVLANSNAGIQESMVYVNIYVRDIERDNVFIENTIRLRELCRLSAELLEVGRVNSSRFQLSEQRVLESASNEHVITNKLLFRQCNN